MDIKRKEGLKRLKERLFKIINDQDIHLDQRLQKLYDESEINELL
jgi:hypothetical protein